jgi:hypothetical protein
VKKITTNDSRIDMAMIGSDRLGLIYFRLYATDDCWMTFRGVKLLCFNFIVKVPAVIENLFGNESREEW